MGRSLDKTGATLVVVEHRVAVWKPLVDRIVVLAPGRDRMPGGVLLDGRPDTVLEKARELLESAGIWLPGYIPATRPRRSNSPPDAGTLLAAEALAVGRERRRRRKPPAPMVSGINARISPVRPSR